MAIPIDKLPPQNLEAEQSVLGSMLIERDAILRAMDILDGEAFYRDAHRKIFEAVISLVERSEAVDIITVAEELRRRGWLEEVGGMAALSGLANIVPTAANVEYYARIVEEKAVLRKLIHAASEIARRVYEGRDDVDELLDQAENLIFSVAQRRRDRSYVSLRDVLIEAYEQIEYLFANKGQITGVPTGLTEFDGMTSGLHQSELIIIAARPSQGKTALCLNIACHAAVRRKVPTAIFSLEMSREQLAQRMLCAEAGVNGHRLRTGMLTEDDWKRLSRALGWMSQAPMLIDDTPNIALMELRAKARRMKAEHDIGLIIIDYLQLMHTRGRSENRQQEISEISRSLKALARELQVPVLALSQLSRAVEQRQDKRPQLSDLRESGCLAGDTMIPLADTGERVPIRDLAGETGFAVWALDPETHRLERALVSRAFPTGVKPVYRLTTRLGRTIRATANHRFFTTKGWKRLDELRVGEFLALPRHLPAAHQQTLSRERALRIAEAFGSEELVRPVCGDIHWDPIVSIEPDGEEEVFDLTVPGPHNFIADGIIAHNSIEQDADVVGFIYHNPEAEENVVELIVAKQRNGPTGSVPLVFLKDIGKFVNLERRLQPA